MVEKNARICDVCENHIAKSKCEICDKDICEECADVVMIGLYQGEGDVLFNINACHKCNKQLSKVCLSDENIFQEVFKERPELLNRIPQHQIASFLGVTPVSLSRIRNRVAKKHRF